MAGSTAGQSASAYCFTGRLRATASCTRSSGESPAASIRSSTACASRCGSIARPAPYRTPRVRSSLTSSSAWYAATRQRCDPRGTTSASFGSCTCDQTARCSTSAIRASPFSTSTAAGTRPGDAHPRDQLLDGRLLRLDLTQRGEDVTDVAQEAGVRPDHEHSGPAELVPIRIEQVRRPVQADRGLPGPGCSLDADGVVDAGPDDHVLLGLDGRDDVAHRA